MSRLLQILLPLIIVSHCINAYAQKFQLIPEYAKKSHVIVHLDCNSIRAKWEQGESRFEYLLYIIAASLTRSDVYVSICDKIDLPTTLFEMDIADPTNNLFSWYEFLNDDYENVSYIFGRIHTITQDMQKKHGGKVHRLFLYHKKQTQDRYDNSFDMIWTRDYSYISAVNGSTLTLLDYLRPEKINPSNINVEKMLNKLESGAINKSTPRDSSYLHLIKHEQPYLESVGARIVHLPITIQPSEITTDSHRNIYISESVYNKNMSHLMTERQCDLLQKENPSETMCEYDIELILRKYLDFNKLIVLKTNKNESTHHLDTVIKFVFSPSKQKSQALLSVSNFSNVDHCNANCAVDQFNRNQLKQHGIEFEEIEDAGAYETRSTYNYVNSLILDPSTVLIPYYVPEDGTQDKFLTAQNQKAIAIYQKHFTHVIPITMYGLTGAVHCMTSDIPMIVPRN